MSVISTWFVAAFIIVMCAVAATATATGTAAANRSGNGALSPPEKTTNPDDKPFVFPATFSFHYNFAVEITDENVSSSVACRAPL